MVPALISEEQEVPAVVDTAAEAEAAAAEVQTEEIPRAAAAVAEREDKVLSLSAMQEHKGGRKCDTL